MILASEERRIYTKLDSLIIRPQVVEIMIPIVQRTALGDKIAVSRLITINQTGRQTLNILHGTRDELVLLTARGVSIWGEEVLRAMCSPIYGVLLVGMLYIWLVGVDEIRFN
jgi:hypothetical protein